MRRTRNPSQGKAKPAFFMALVLMVTLGALANADKVSAKKKFNPTTECTDADRGPYPFEYEAMVNWYIERNFFDPGSVQGLVIAKPIPGWQSKAMVKTTRDNTDCTWYIGFAANAKNRMGGYIGRQDNGIWVKNGVILSAPVANNPLFLGQPGQKYMGLRSPVLSVDAIIDDGEEHYARAWARLDPLARARVRHGQGELTLPGLEPAETSDDQTDGSEESSVDYIEELRQLAELRDQGILTEEEFQERKKQVLERQEANEQ